MRKTILIIVLIFSFSISRAFEESFYREFSILAVPSISVSFLFDNQVKKSIKKNKNQFFNGFTSFFNQFGAPSTVSIPVLGYIFSKINKDKKLEELSRQAFFASIFAGGTSFCIKKITGRKRPDKTDKDSFPSGHTAVSTAIFLTYGKYFNDYKKYFFYSIPVFVGFSRIYKNRHYFSDVVAGCFLGFLSVYLSKKFDSFFVKNIKSFVYYDLSSKKYTLNLKYLF